MHHQTTQGWYRFTQHPRFRRFFQGTGEQKEPYMTNGRNVYILPTKSGLSFAVILLVMLIGAINYNNSLGYMFIFFLASLSIVTILHTYKNILRLQILIGKPRPVFCGETTRVPLYINQATDIKRYALSLIFDQSTFDDHASIDITSRNNIVQLPLTTTTRGLCAVPRFTLVSTFPLGLFRSWAHMHLYQRFIVYPKPATNAPDLPSGQYLLDQNGDQGKGTDDFSGLRNYHQGDSLRHVHWKAFAKQGAMITKQFGGDRSDETWLDWESLPDKEVEARLSILTRWVINAEIDGVAYGLKLPGMVIKPSAGAIHRDHCLQTLALYGLSK